MKNLKNKIKNNKGITLVALVITIIILLILSGVAISQLTDSGLFGKSQNAKQKWENAQELENSILGDYENEIKNFDKDTKVSDTSNMDFILNSGVATNELTPYYKDHNAGSLQEQTGYITWKSGGAYQYSNLLTENKIDLTDYSALKFLGYINSENTDSGHLIITNSNETVRPDSTDIVKQVTLTTTLKMFTIDVSDLTGEYYIGVIGSNRTIYLYDMILTKNQNGFLIMDGSENVELKEYYEDHAAGSLQDQTGYKVWNSGGAFQYSNLLTKNKIDLTKYSTISFLGYINSENNESGHFVITNSNETVRAESTDIVKKVELTTGMKKYTIDVSDLTGEYYIGVIGSNRTIYLYNLWLQ